MLRRTTSRLAGDARYIPWHMPFDVPGDQIRGAFLLPYRGPFKILRFFDLKWMGERQNKYCREWVYAAPLLAMSASMMIIGVPVMAADPMGPPRRQVDWNTEEAGKLPEGFQSA